ncbi:hypothetical protein [Argonema antarcticum]|nr:hypothetical protein [Argonema antarcticum]MCL1471939.1 hypothetical protein [Argonema antarcticum A004/B2]
MRSRSKAIPQSSCEIPNQNPNVIHNQRCAIATGCLGYALLKPSEAP